LRSAVPAFSSNSRVTVGGVTCNDMAVSADGRWIAFFAPDPLHVCHSPSATCSYATIVVSNQHDNATRGATLACPPFCSGSLGNGSGVVPLVSNVTAPAAVPAARLSSGLVLPLSLSDYAAGTVSGDIVLPFPAGLYYSEACSASLIYTAPTTGACTNTSDPRSAFCAFGGGNACRPCPSGAICPGGFRCWPLAGFYVPVEGTADVRPCGEPGGTVRCAGWSTALSQTRCGPGYLQVRLRALEKLVPSCTPRCHLFCGSITLRALTSVARALLAST
jgi:hypothetical protein